MLTKTLLCIFISFALNACARSQPAVNHREVLIPSGAPAGIDHGIVNCLEKKVSEGDIRGGYALWTYLAGGGNYEEAFPWLDRAAESNYPPAIYSSAYRYVYSDDGAKAAIALQTLKDLANKGYYFPAVELSSLYHLGSPTIPPDAGKSAYWKKKAGKLTNVFEKEEKETQALLAWCRDRQNQPRESASSKGPGQPAYGYSNSCHN